MLRPSRFLSITVMFCVLVTLTGCPRGKDLPSRIDNGFEVTAGSTLLGAVFADTDGWTAYSNISGDPVAVWNDFAKRSRSFTFRSIGDARSSCSISGSRLVCRAASHPEGSNTEAILVSMTYGAWRPFGSECRDAWCGGTRERSFVVRYLQGSAAKVLPALEPIDGSPVTNGFRTKSVLPRADTTLGGKLTLTQPAPFELTFPDGTVTLGTPVTISCGTEQGVGIVDSVESAPKWMQQVLEMPSAPRLQRLGIDEVFTGTSHAFSGFDVTATGTRTADGDYVVLRLCAAATKP